MLTETARVVSVEREALWVETIRRSTCGSCAVQKGCGHGLMNRMGDGRRNYLRVPAAGENLAAYAVDDDVTISLPEDALLRGSFIVYIGPLLLLMVGAAVASALWPAAGDIAPVLGAMVGFGIGVLGVRWHAWQHREDSRYQPTLVGKSLQRDREPVVIASA